MKKNKAEKTGRVQKMESKWGTLRSLGVSLWIVGNHEMVVSR